MITRTKASIAYSSASICDIEETPFSCKGNLTASIKRKRTNQSRVQTQVAPNIAKCNTPRRSNLSRNCCCVCFVVVFAFVFVLFFAASVAESRNWFYFSIAATLLSTFLPLRSVTSPMQLVSQCFVRSSNQDLINLSSVLLGRSFASCWQSHCTVKHPSSCNCNATLLNFARQVWRKKCPV